MNVRGITHSDEESSLLIYAAQDGKVPVFSDKTKIVGAEATCGLVVTEASEGEDDMEMFETCQDNTYLWASGKASG